MASKLLIFSIVSKSKITREAFSSHGTKISRTSPLKLNSPRTVTLETLVYPNFESLSEIFTVSKTSPFFSLNENLLNTQALAKEK